MRDHKSIQGFADRAGHAALVRSVVAGELPQTDERVQRLVAGCGPCSHQLNEHAQILTHLNAGRDLELESILTEAKLANGFPGDDHVDAVLRSILANYPLAAPGGGRWRFRFLAALSTAAASALALVVHWPIARANAPTVANDFGRANETTASAHALGERIRETHALDSCATQ